MDYRRVQLLKAATYAREELSPGRVVVVDPETATRWLTAKIAVEARELGVIATSCPRCGCAMQYPEVVEPDKRWTHCKNPRCGFGWMR